MDPINQGNHLHDDLDVNPKNVQRLYLQSQLYKPFMREEEALAIYEQCCLAVNVPYYPNNFPTFLTDINTRIDELNLSIRQVRHHSLPISYIILVNMEADSIAKLSTSYKPMEIIVFRELVNEICQSESGQITSVDILNHVPSTLMSKGQYEKIILTRLINEGWLEETMKGNYTLGIRCLVELNKYIEETFPDIDHCKYCGNIVIIKLMCPTCPTGTTYYHPQCLRENINNQGIPLPCPDCQQIVPLPNDNDAVYHSSSTSSTTSSSGISTRNKRIRHSLN